MTEAETETTRQTGRNIDTQRASVKDFQNFENKPADYFHQSLNVMYVATDPQMNV